MLYRLNGYNFKFEKGEGEELNNLDLSYVKPNSLNILYCDVFAPVELNEYIAYIEEVKVTDEGTTILFREINTENEQPLYKLYQIPAKYDHLVEGLPIIFECIYEPDYFGTIEELKTRRVKVYEVISSPAPKNDSYRLKDIRRPFPVGIYSLSFEL